MVVELGFPSLSVYLKNKKPCHDKTCLWGFQTSLQICMSRRDVPFGVPLDLSTLTGMSCIGTYGENCESDNVSKYCVLSVAFQLL